MPTCSIRSRLIGVGPLVKLKRALIRKRKGVWHRSEDSAAADPSFMVKHFPIYTLFSPQLQRRFYVAGIRLKIWLKPSPPPTMVKRTFHVRQK